MNKGKNAIPLWGKQNYFHHPRDLDISGVNPPK
jgi:hypothetical protein